MKRVLVTTVVSVLLATAACGKKDDAAKSDDKAKTAEKTADKPADKPAGEMTAADYEAKNVDMMDKAAAMFASAGTDCDKAAAVIGKFFDDNKAPMEALVTFEKAHPDVKKQVDDKYKDKTKAFQDTIGKVIEPCKDNKAMQDALKKFPG
jgi:hypothetical protein